MRTCGYPLFVLLTVATGCLGSGPTTIGETSEVTARSADDLRRLQMRDHPSRQKSKAASPQFKPGIYFVVGEVQVKLGPSVDSKVTNRLYQNQRVEVFETKDGWARISKYYDGRVESLSGQIARWVPSTSLSSKRPTPKGPPELPRDPRINGIPEIGHGVNEEEYYILQAAARFFLESGKTKRIEYGDRSGSRPNTYYFNFGGARNHFFTAKDIPNLKSRVRALREVATRK